jgi:hypothetical protein
MLTHVGNVDYDPRLNVYCLECYFQNSKIPEKLYLPPSTFLPISLTNIIKEEDV